LDRCERHRFAVPGLAAASAFACACAVGLAGCNYSSGPSPVFPAATTGPALGPTAGGSVGTAANPSPSGAAPGNAPPAQAALAGEVQDQKTAILNNVIKLIQSAAITPGGSHFEQAIKHLNQYFEGTPAADYALAPEARKFLEAQLPKKRVDELEAAAWTMPDTRHVEDCMLYHGIASRVGGPGDDLARARRVFEWMVNQVQLVPAGSLSLANVGQAYARPYDVLLRGLATESEGMWSERGWLFLSLCRQLGLDGGLVTYTPPGAKEPVVWCVAILVDEKDKAGDRVVPRAYLFDTRVGLPVPDAKGDGVATLDDAMTDPVVLDRMDLPGQSPYGTTRAALLGSTSKLGILLDSSLRYFSPRMRLLQRSLAGKDLTVLFRDPAAQRDHWAKALGPRLGKVGLWELPMAVETLLFTDPKFVEATQASLSMFRPELPLLYARVKQLRGETAEAVQDYVSMRFAENAVFLDNNKQRIPPALQQVLDVYATYFLGMCHLDQKHPDKAEFFFEKTLQMLPAPGRGQPYFYMFRWGAQADLARLREAKGDAPGAIAYYAQNDPTSQRHGNLLRARELVWRDPTAPPPKPVPLPPPPVAPSARAADATAPGKVVK
jgi:hypothetical protein